MIRAANTNAVEPAPPAWVVPPPMPRASWHRWRVVITLEVDARHADEATTKLDAYDHPEASSCAVELEQIEPTARPAPSVAHPPEWREAMAAAVEPDAWIVRRVPGSWCWLTDGGIALRVPDGVAGDDVLEIGQHQIREGAGVYAAARPERSSLVTDTDEPTARLGAAVVQRRYVWLVAQLFGAVSWMAAGATDPVRAFGGDGRLVALVMPVDTRGL